MSQVNPNGTYKGRVYDAGASNDATLTIVSSDPQTGSITNARMEYYGLSHVVDGTFAYQNLTNDSSVSFVLRAEVKSGEYNLHNITLRSPDRNYTSLDGEIYVARGGANVGKTYNVTFTKC